MTDSSKAAEEVHGVASGLFDLLIAAARHRTVLAHELGLGTTDVVALWEIARRPKARPSELARALGVGVAGMTSVVDKLARSGFVRREKDGGDRRSVNVVLTPAGRHAYAWLQEELDAVVRRVPADVMDPAVADRVLSALTTAFAERASE